MAVYQLENEHIYLEVASHGAELVRLVGKKTKKEYLFDGDPKYWKRHSPILFPFVVRSMLALGVFSQPRTRWAGGR